MIVNDPFSLLDVPLRYELDRADLDRRMRRAAARLHPDRTRDPIAAEENATRLAEMHAAADLLRDDLKRADRLIDLWGGPDASGEQGLPDGFLESMLDVRMELESALQAGDEQGIERLEAWATSEWSDRRQAVAALLVGDRPVPEDDRRAARRELNRWRYIQRMLEQLHPSLASMDL